MNTKEKEKIIKEFDFYKINTEADLHEEIARMLYLIITCNNEVFKKLYDKFWTIEEFYQQIKECIKDDLSSCYLGTLIKCAKKIYNCEDLENIFYYSKEYINKKFEEDELILIGSISDIFNFLEIKDNKIVFPLKWFSPLIYKKITEFLKTFNCERTKMGKQTAFKNNGEFTNEQILEIGKKLNGVSLSTKFDFFPTPKELAQKVRDLAEIKDNDIILEPSAGTGSLLTGLNKENIYCVELNEILTEILKAKGYKVENCAFEDYQKNIKFDKILMNPPFSKRLDAKHILRAFEFLKNRGLLVAIHSTGILTATDKASKNFQDLCKKYAVYQEKISDKAFANSGKGTNIDVVITKFKKY